MRNKEMDEEAAKKPVAERKKRGFFTKRDSAAELEAFFEEEVGFAGGEEPTPREVAKERLQAGANVQEAPVPSVQAELPAEEEATNADNDFVVRTRRKTQQAPLFAAKKQEDNPAPPQQASFIDMASEAGGEVPTISIRTAPPESQQEETEPQKEEPILFEEDENRPEGVAEDIGFSFEGAEKKEETEQEEGFYWEEHPEGVPQKGAAENTAAGKNNERVYFSQSNSEAAGVTASQQPGATLRIGRDKILTKLGKPDILLETPYMVNTKKGEAVRYRLEFGHPDQAIPPEQATMPSPQSQPQDKLDPVDSAEPLKKAKTKDRVVNKIFEWVRLLVIALLLAFVIRHFVMVFVWVEGKSMVPTLHDKEYMLVTRFDYLFGQPKRQDIIICNFENYPKSTRFVKRVIGVPGDVLEIRAGVVYVNGEALDEPYIQNHKANENIAAFTVPEDNFYVMGDNRSGSTDSRVVGFIKREDVLGHVRLVIYPFDQMKQVD